MGECRIPLVFLPCCQCEINTRCVCVCGHFWPGQFLFSIPSYSVIIPHGGISRAFFLNWKSQFLTKILANILKILPKTSWGWGGGWIFKASKVFFLGNGSQAGGGGKPYKRVRFCMFVVKWNKWVMIVICNCSTFSKLCADNYKRHTSYCPGEKSPGIKNE